MGTCGEGFRGGGNGLKFLPAAGVGDLDGVGDGVAVELKVEGTAFFVGGDGDGEVVGAGLGNVDGVEEPFAGTGPADAVAIGGVGPFFDVDLGVGAVGFAEVFGIDVVVSDFSGAVVVVFHFQLAGNGEGCAAIGGVGCRGNLGCGCSWWGCFIGRGFCFFGLCAADKDEGECEEEGDVFLHGWYPWVWFVGWGYFTTKGMENTKASRACLQ